MRIIMALVSIMFFFLSVTAVFADPKPAVGPRGHHADKNKDGMVDHKEVQMQKAEHKEKACVNTKWEARADTDNDGVVEPVEAKEMKETMKEKFDLNNDGVVDKTEKMVSWQHSRAKVNTLLEQKYDANNDGWLEPVEAKELVKDRYELIKTDGKAKADTDIEKEYDTNKDGILDQGEAKAMFNDIK